MQKNEDPAEFYKPEVKFKARKKKDEASREIPGEKNSSFLETSKEETFTEELPAEDVTHDTGAVEVSTFFTSI